MSEDSKVLAGESIVNRRWMVPDNDGQMNWYLSTKLPLKNKRGEIIGICGLLKDLKRSGVEFKPYYDLSKIISYIDQHYHQKIKLETLAEIFGLSISQFERKFKTFTGVSPMIYIVKVRLAAVAHGLHNSDKTIGQLALEHGFYDHSQLSRTFKEHYQMSPMQYRKNSR